MFYLKFLQYILLSSVVANKEERKTLVLGPKKRQNVEIIRRPIQTILKIVLCSCLMLSSVSASFICSLPNLTNVLNVFKRLQRLLRSR